MQKDHKMEDTLHKIWSFNLDAENDDDLLDPAGFETCSIFEFFQDLSLDSIVQNNKFEDDNFINLMNDTNYFEEIDRI